MTHDEILQAAKEATNNQPIYGRKEFTFSSEELKNFAAIIEKRTIEKCAQEIEWEDDVARPGSFYASEIRKLGEQ